MNEEEMQKLCETIEDELYKIRTNKAYINGKSYFSLSYELLIYIRKLEKALNEIEEYFNRPEWEEDNLPSTSHCDAKEDILEIINKAKERIEKVENGK